MAYLIVPNLAITCPANAKHVIVESRPCAYLTGSIVMDGGATITIDGEVEYETEFPSIDTSKNVVMILRDPVVYGEYNTGCCLGS